MTLLFRFNWSCRFCRCQPQQFSCWFCVSSVAARFPNFICRSYKRQSKEGLNYRHYRSTSTLGPAYYEFGYYQGVFTLPDTNTDFAFTDIGTYTDTMGLKPNCVSVVASVGMNTSTQFSTTHFLSVSVSVSASVNTPSLIQYLATTIEHFFSLKWTFLIDISVQKVRIQKTEK